MMNITNARAAIDAGGYPILRLTIDGRPAYVLEPKQSLLEAGIVVLLDDENYWENKVSAELRPRRSPEREPGEDFAEIEIQRIRGGATDARLIEIVRRFASGETGNLLAD